MNFDDERLEKLILDGIVEFAGLDEDGEMLYQFANDLEQKDPELFSFVINKHLSQIYELWELGFVVIDDITSPDPLVRISKLALDQEAVAGLRQELQFALKEIIEISRER